MASFRSTIILLLFTGTLCRVMTADTDNPHVTFLQGTISGQRIDAGNERFIYAFKGIPYAKPPVGELRFKDAVPGDSWTGVRDGSITPPKCPQTKLAAINQENINVFGQEDCLYLNVYTPRPFASDLPVMVYFHAGGFLVGDVTDLSPLPLLTEDVVLVTFNYRIGTLSFLSTEDEVLPGNLGLKDQTLALRWVKENIKPFGGDPNKVTIFGLSAGAESIHFHILSPYTKGLFKRAILQSGTVLTGWSLRRDHKSTAVKIAKKFKCSGAGETAENFNSVAFLQCLQTIPAESLVPLVIDHAVWDLSPQVMMPRIDGYFMPTEPAQLAKEGGYDDVDIITGIARDDGDTTSKLIYESETLKDSLVNNFSTMGQLAIAFRDEDDNPEYLARRVFYHYLGGIKINDDNADDVTKLFTLAQFSVGHDRTALLHARHSKKNVYMYELHHRGEHSFVEVPNKNVTKKWIGHGDDLQYLFDSVSGRKPLRNQDDLMVRHIMVKLWTNFAKTGNPTPDQSLGFRWWPVKNDCLKYLKLTPAPSMEADYRAQDREFFNDLPRVQSKILYPERFLPNYTEPSGARHASCQ